MFQTNTILNRVASITFFNNCCDSRALLVSFSTSTWGGVNVKVWYELDEGNLFYFAVFNVLTQIEHVTVRMINFTCSTCSGVRLKCLPRSLEWHFRGRLFWCIESSWQFLRFITSRLAAGTGCVTFISKALVEHCSCNKHTRILSVIVTFTNVRFLILCDISFSYSCEARYLTLAVDDKLLTPSEHKFSSFTCSFNGKMAAFNTQIAFGI